MSLFEIQSEVQQRVAEVESGHAQWPCRKGCDDCCRSLAAQPRVTQAEWELIAAALTPEKRLAIRGSSGSVCPLLDQESGSCSIYAVRPLACRTYGFYAERQYVLGCHRIEEIATNTSDVVWGNHAALEAKVSRELGESMPLSYWLES